ncbi:MAG: CoA-binding protein [Bacteroidetes bacterium]|nr:CoA-binding protein [Bacteroidota bacterium]
MSKYTLVIGASENESRYSNMAIKKLVKYGHPVAAIGLRDGKVEGIPFSKEHKVFADIDTVTLYINETHQQDYYDYILSLNPKRIIFNPGTENPELEKLANQKGIEAVEACTLVMLGTGQY